MVFDRLSAVMGVQAVEYRSFGYLMLLIAFLTVSCLAFSTFE